MLKFNIDELRKLVMDLELYGTEYNQHAEITEGTDSVDITVRDTSAYKGRESIVTINDTALLPIIQFAAANGYGWSIEGYSTDNVGSAVIGIRLFPEDYR